MADEEQTTDVTTPDEATVGPTWGGVPTAPQINTGDGDAVFATQRANEPQLNPDYVRAIWGPTAGGENGAEPTERYVDNALLRTVPNFSPNIPGDLHYADVVGYVDYDEEADEEPAFNIGQVVIIESVADTELPEELIGLAVVIETIESPDDDTDEFWYGFRDEAGELLWIGESAIRDADAPQPDQDSYGRKWNVHADLVELVVDDKAFMSDWCSRYEGLEVNEESV